MPSNILGADTGFPQFTGQETTEQKIDTILNYLYMLLEQLRYTLRNLDSSNFNETGLSEITESIYASIADSYGNLAELALTAEALETRISDAEGNISTLTQTATTIESRLSDAEGNISTLTQTVSSISLSVTSSSGGTASIVLSVNGESTGDTVSAVTSARTAFAAEDTACTITAGTVTFNSNTFVVNSTYFGVTATGVITATSGTIGAITLSSTGIYSGGTYVYTGEDDPGDIRSTGYVGWYRPTDMDDGDDTISFYAGASGTSAYYIASAPFRVTYGGSVIATDFKTGGSFEVYSSSALTTLGGYMGYLTGSTGSEETIGVGVIDATGTNYLIATDAGVRMSGETADLYVSGDKIVANGAVTCKDALTVTGAATLSSTLTVSGAATLSSTLSVTGVVTLANSVNIANGAALRWADSDGTYRSTFFVSGSSLYLGWGGYTTNYIGNAAYPTYLRGSTLYVGNASYPTCIRGSNIYIGSTLLDTYITNLVGSSGSSNITLATSAPSSLDDGAICLVYV